MVKKRLVIISILSIFIASLFMVSDIAAVNNLTNGSILNQITTNYNWVTSEEETDLVSKSITDPITEIPEFSAQQEYDIINSFGWWNESARIENTKLINGIKIANDEDNNAHIFWSSKIGGDWILLHIINFAENTSWSAIETLGATDSYTFDVLDVESDSQGRIHLVYKSHTIIKYRMYADGEWQRLNDIGQGLRPHLEITSSDKPVVVFQFDVTLYGHDWWYAEYNEFSEEWTRERINMYTNYWSTNYLNFDFALVKEHGVEIGYFFMGKVIETGDYLDRDYYIEYQLLKRINETNGFQYDGYYRLYELPGPIYHLSQPLIVEGVENEFHLIYHRPIDIYNFELKYHKHSAITGWGTNKVLSTSLSLKCDVTAKVDSIGRLLIFWNNLYYDGPTQVADLYMKMYSPNQGKWSGTYQMVDDHGYIQLNQMALDLDGNVHLTWIDKIDDNKTIHYKIGWADSDEDALIDKDEIDIYGTDPHNPDTDGDQLLDGEEIEYGFDPFDPDEDTDGMHDGYEFHYGLDPYTNDSYLDLDSDLLLNIEEFIANTLPNTNDSDSDNVSDYDEVKTYFTNPRRKDTDDDDIQDGIEIFDLGSDPNSNDTDSDGMLDHYEWIYMLLITVNDSYDDPDGDGLVNILEFENGIRPDRPDTDNDFLNDYDEVIVWGTHPINLDTDDDGIWDGIEVHTYGTHPLMTDTDTDFLDDYDEIFVAFTNATNNDTDGDLMIDGFEWFFGLNPLDDTDWSYDPDGDGLINREESYLFTNPFSSDTDGDNLLDNEELEYGTNPARYDTDEDGLSDYVEIIVLKTNATNPDTDYDGLSDYLEVHIYSSDPKKQDSDEDGLLDGEEVNVHGSNPTQKDTDEDKLEDKDEVDFGSSPVMKDTDADGMEDYFEWLYGLDPLYDDSSEDPDGDGVRNGEEFIYKANPLVNDTDSDGLDDYLEIVIYYTLAYSNDTDQDLLSDYDEIMVYFTLPHDPDTDDDTIFDGTEVSIGTSPTLYDTDSDGVSDGEEIADNTDPLDPNDNIYIIRTRIIAITFSSIVCGLILYNFGPQLIIRLRRHEESKWIRQGIIWRKKKSEILMHAANEEQARLAYTNNKTENIGE